MNREEMLEHLAMTLPRWPQDCVECREITPGYGWAWYDEAPDCEFVLARADDAEPIRERDWLAVSWTHGEERMENVGRNGGEALHYAQAPCGSDINACLLNPCGQCHGYEHAEDSDGERQARRGAGAMTRCPYNDCGWCYCPKGKWHNSKGGQCQKPRECPQVIARERAE